MLCRVEVRVAPDGRQFGGAQVPGVAAVGKIDFGAVVRAAERVAGGHAAVRAGDVGDLFTSLAVLDPALDHLQALERCAVRVAGGPDQEAGAPALVGEQVAAHRHTALVGGGDHVRVGGQVVRVAVAAEEPEPHPRAAGGVGLLAAEGVVDRVAGVLFGPDHGQPGTPPVPSRSVLLAVLGGLVDWHGAAKLAGAVAPADLAVEVVLFGCAARVVGVGRADDAEAERVEALGLLEHEAVHVGLADVTALRFAVELRGDAVGEDLEVRPLVVRRQQRVRLRGAFDLGHLDQGFVAHPQLGVGRVERLAADGLELEHVAVAAVRVVRDGKALDAFVPAFVEPAPEVLGIARVGRGEGHGRHVAALEDHVAVQVAPVVRRGRVLVADEGGEVPGVVVGLGGVDDRLPGAALGVVLRVLR